MRSRQIEIEVVSTLLESQHTGNFHSLAYGIVSPIVLLSILGDRDFHCFVDTVSCWNHAIYGKCRESLVLIVGAHYSRLADGSAHCYVTLNHIACSFILTKTI